ncbi:hypothetical protein SAMN02745136_05729 [Anaerocolumna jejuensis DSM 15929]|uniref:Uncharacterized protein n=1 Tax=Anaerocolumna jejuensis DSM 15929 TaxID=1121322 RepID=A0A1M7DLK0_9FIRM|nr:hypothetical protein SAMN02745136_05729 [Anaerocolumna jejuensis DSM 15929]
MKVNCFIGENVHRVLPDRNAIKLFFQRRLRLKILLRSRNGFPVKQNETIRLSKQDFDAVASLTAKKIDRAAIWFGFQLVQNDSTETIYRFSHIGIPTLS